MLVGIHLWTFRKPETPDPSLPQRLPGPLPAPWVHAGRLEPEIHRIQVEPGWRFPDEALAGGRDAPRRVDVRLSRYRDRAATRRLAAHRPPLLAIHGYSAGGTTFAHPALRPSLAAYFAERGRDVWVVDLRTSCGLPHTARYPWRFEDVAWNDIPSAIEHLLETTGSTTVDVIAHCMGAVMLSMAVLRPSGSTSSTTPALRALPGRLGRVVLSQGGPVLTFSPANRLRAMVMDRMRQLLGAGTYQTRASVPPSAADDLLDRLLAALPYRDASDFRRTNPLWAEASATRWVRTRHRLDALFGETFPLDAIERPVLDAIDDFFGPMSLETVAQPIRYAAAHQIASSIGALRDAEQFTTREDLLKDRWPYETRHFVGMRNGLIDPETLQRSRMAFRSIPTYRTHALGHFGHQDVLIGRDARKCFALFERFLDGGHAAFGSDEGTMEER